MILLTLLTVLNLIAPITSSAIIDGYTSSLSAFPGESISLYLNASYPDERYKLRLYDLKGKEVFSVQTIIFPQERSRNKPSENGFDYKVTTTIKVPNLPSGVYLWEKSIPFIIKTHHPQVVVVYPSNTENAYCNAGGKSLYDYSSDENKRAFKLSFHRPIALDRYAQGLLYWLARQPYKDVGYISDMDMDDYAHINKASLIIIPGHSEYWTRQARINFDKFVHRGKHAMILSGNTMWLQVHYNKEKNQMICYKNDPSEKIKSPNDRTTFWNDPVLEYPILASIGVDFTFAGYGRKQDRGWDGFKIITDSPLLENTHLTKGDILPCTSDEYDGTPLMGFNDRGNPVVNRLALGFEKIEIVGYDYAFRGGSEGVATWIVFQPTKTSGIIINTASTDWCSFSGIGNNADIEKITHNMIYKLLHNHEVFSPNAGKESMGGVVD